MLYYLTSQSEFVEVFFVMFNNQNYYRLQAGIQYASELEIQGYLLSPNMQIMALDREKPILYIKSADNLGRSVLTKYKFEQIVDTPAVPEDKKADYLTKADLQEFVSKADLQEFKTSIEEKLKGIKNVQQQSIK